VTTEDSYLSLLPDEPIEAGRSFFDVFVSSRSYSSRCCCHRCRIIFNEKAALAAEEKEGQGPLWSLLSFAHLIESLYLPPSCVVFFAVSLRFSLSFPAFCTILVLLLVVDAVVSPLEPRHQGFHVGILHSRARPDAQSRRCVPVAADIK
jgi:hypothetical protein